MKKTPLLAIILVLLFYCLSLGNGDKSVKTARGNLHLHYSKLTFFLKNPDTLRPGSTVFQHLREVNDKQKKWQFWLQTYTRFSLEQLKKPPGSIMSEDELKLATEFHLFLSGWYHVRFITLDKAAKRDYQVGHWYPRKNIIKFDKATLRNHRIETWYPLPRKCRNAAQTALKYSKDHYELYTQYYRALDGTARYDIMKKIKFPNHVNPEKQNHGENDAFLRVRTHLGKGISRLLRWKTSMKPSAVKKNQSIRAYLLPDRMNLNEDFLSKICYIFPVEDFSLPPHKASRSDKEFVEVAWLLNEYRSLWYERRREILLKFFRHKKEDLTTEFTQQLKKAVRLANGLFQQYSLLCNDYHENLDKNQPEGIVDVQNTSSPSDCMNVEVLIHSSEPVQWRGKRKRTALSRIRNLVPLESNEAADQQSFDEDSENLQCQKHSKKVALPEWNLNEPPPLMENETERPELDLNKPAPEAENDSYLIDAHPAFHSHVAGCARNNNQQLYASIEMNLVAPKRTKFTQSEDNHPRSSPNLDSIHQLPSEKCISEFSRNVEN